MSIERQLVRNCGVRHNFFSNRTAGNWNTLDATTKSNRYGDSSLPQHLYYYYYYYYNLIFDQILRNDPMVYKNSHPIPIKCSSIGDFFRYHQAKFEEVEGNILQLHFIHNANSDLIIGSMIPCFSFIWNIKFVTLPTF
ncbi:hypothetical protein BpHYR1_046006 [Brachionus plicatilis]|uniref:Uncharacterized protein n=1 Tax=Brachionus plicatilis TaxID=10195 RepID=A0A3M7PDT5_BRAPC|nr:hypothetical protein BpHYR1_046006 [Brachionus plicatilis]